jgi:hypothetical protein
VEEEEGDEGLEDADEEGSGGEPLPAASKKPAPKKKGGPSKRPSTSAASRGGKGKRPAK